MDEFNLREAQLRNELWLLVDRYSDLHGNNMANIFEEFAEYSKTSIDDLPGEDFDSGKVTEDTEVTSINEKFDAQTKEKNRE